MYYLQSRYYDPVVKRMICADDESMVAGATLSDNNLFSYCDNNPVNRADADGEFWHIVAGAVVGAGISVGVQVLGNLISGEKWSSGIGAAALSGAITGGIGAIPGMSSCAQAVVNGVTSGAIELYNQTQVYKEKNVSAIVNNVAISVMTSSVEPLVGTRMGKTGSPLRNAAKIIEDAGKSTKKAAKTLYSRAAKQGGKRLVSGMKTCAKLCKRSFVRALRKSFRGNVKSFFKSTWANVSLWNLKRYNKQSE